MQRVSVVMPAQGDLPWFAQTARSLEGQTRRADEIILVDDGLSDPESAHAICSQYFGADYRIIPSSGSGISAALNTGIAASNGDYILRLDTDDLAEPERIERQLAAIDDLGPEFAGCGSQVTMIKHRGKPLTASRFPESWEEIDERARAATCFCHPSMIFRRAALSDVPYRSELDGAEDIDLYARLLDAGYRLCNLPDRLVRYRLHASQTSFDRRARQKATQELVWRLARARVDGRDDPVDCDPNLASEFIDWRTAQPRFSSSRKLLTILRYAATHFAGRDYRTAFSKGALATSFVLREPSVVFQVARLIGGGMASFHLEPCPFPELNAGRASP